ncbi:MAG: GNAT family N-acetyltransferase [Pararobbsia sp.]
MNIAVRTLGPADLLMYHAFRLRGLEAHPEAFTSDHDEAEARGPEMLRHRLSADPASGNFVLGAFDRHGRLVGMVGLERLARKKESHTALLFGMYVPAEIAGQGIGRRLLQDVLDRARQVPGVERIQLTVTRTNAPAVHLYESVGFKAFGMETGAIRVDGQYYDKVYMALVLARSGAISASSSIGS